MIHPTNIISRQTDRQTGQWSDSIGQAVLQTVAQKLLLRLYGRKSGLRTDWDFFWLTVEFNIEGRFQEHRRSRGELFRCRLCSLLVLVQDAGIPESTRGISVSYTQPFIKERKGKEEYLYSAFLHQGTHKALRHGSRSFTCKQHHACLSFVAFTRCHHHSN